MTREKALEKIHELFPECDIFEHPKNPDVCGGYTFYVDNYLVVDIYDDRVEEHEYREL